MSPWSSVSTGKMMEPSEGYAHGMPPLLSSSASAGRAAGPAASLAAQAVVKSSLPFLKSCRYGRQPRPPPVWCRRDSSLPSGFPIRGMVFMMQRRSSSGSLRGLTPSSMLLKYWRYRRCEGIVSSSISVRREPQTTCSPSITLLHSPLHAR